LEKPPLPCCDRAREEGSIRCSLKEEEEVKKEESKFVTSTGSPVGDAFAAPTCPFPSRPSAALFKIEEVDKLGERFSCIIVDFFPSRDDEAAEAVAATAAAAT
jgi:hypothetical protein